MPAQTCGKCAAIIPEGENFCPACGAPAYRQEGFEKPDAQQHNAGYGDGQTAGAGFGPEGFEKPDAQQHNAGYGDGQTAGAGFGPEGFEKPHYDQAYTPGGYYPPGYGTPPGQQPPPYVYVYAGPPPDDSPTSARSYLGHIILYSLGVIGLALTIIFMRDTSRSQNFRNFSKAFLILNAIGIAISFILFAVYYSMFVLFFYAMV